MIVNPGIRRFLGSAIQRLFNSASFYAPLTHSVVPERGTGSPSFTRASTATFRDWEGVLRTVPAGCARFEGARMVQNLWTTSSATLANGANKSLTLAAGDYTFSMGAGTGTATFSGTGGATGTLAASAAGRVEVTKTITAGTFVVTASVADLVDLQVEYVTGQTTQTAGKYVSVGALDYRSTQDPLYLSLPGTAGHYASTPDSVAASVAGDIDIRVQAALADWTPAGGYMALCSKFGAAGNRSWIFDVAQTTGKLRLWSSIDGTTATSAQESTASPSIQDGGTLWVRVTRAASGINTFYTSADGATWTQLGDAVATAAFSMFDSTAAVEVGSYASGTGELLNGSIYRAQIYNTIGGTTPVVDFNPQRDATTPTGTITSSTTSEVWTINGASSVVRSAAYHGAGVDGVEFFNTDREGALLSPQPAYLAETADVLAHPTASNILAAASTVYLEFTPNHTPSGTIALWGTYVDASNYTAILHDATNMIMRKRIAGVNYDATIANAFTANTTYKVCGSWGASGVTITLDGTEGTLHANTTAAQIAATMQWGADGNSLQQPFAYLRNCRDWLRQLSASERVAVTA